MKPLVLSLLPRPPHTSRDGLAIRNYHLLAALAGAFRVRALALADPERAYEGEWPSGVDVEVVPQVRRRWRRMGAAFSSLLAGGAYSERLYRSGALSRRLATVLSEEPPLWILALFLLQFFRDPARKVPEPPPAVSAPVAGRTVESGISH